MARTVLQFTPSDGPLVLAGSISLDAVYQEAKVAPAPPYAVVARRNRADPDVGQAGQADFLHGRGRRPRLIASSISADGGMSSMR